MNAEKIQSVNYLMNALENYLSQKISGQELLDAWINAPKQLQGIYYNLCHLVADEDIRQKDSVYATYQNEQLISLIQGLKTSKDINYLQDISFL